MLEIPRVDIPPLTKDMKTFSRDFIVRMQLRQILQSCNALSFLSPVILIALVNAIAIISIECCIIAFLVFPVMISTFYVYVAKSCAKTKFFVVFAITSGVFLLGLFEFFVPLLELLPQENFIFISLTFTSLLLFYKTYQRSLINRLGHSESETKQDDQVTLLVSDDKLPDFEDELEAPSDRNSCNICRKFIPARTFHCGVCKACVITRDHHNFFLNCCVGRFNHRLFYAGCITTLLTLVFFANLSLTSVCRPYQLFTIFGVTVMVPNDCTGVFFESEIAICFVGAIFALELAFMLFLVLIQQTYLISKGLTSTEFHVRGERRPRHNCLRNWKNFFL